MLGSTCLSYIRTGNLNVAQWIEYMTHDLKVVGSSHTADANELCPY